MSILKVEIILPSILILLVLSSCSSLKSTDLINAVIPASNFEKTQMVYGTHQRQKLDVYIPKSTTLKTPIVFVYGGAWREGSKEDFKFVGHALASLGHPVIVPDYRRYPEVKFPDFVNDVADAMVFFEQQSAKFLDKPMDEFIVMGHSAGAHMVSLLTTERSYLQSRKLKAKITGLIAMAGPYDLPLDDPEVAPVFTNITRQQTNPILNIHSQMPSVLLIHGLDDDRVFPFHTRRFEKALLQSNISVKTHLYEGVNHTQLIGSLAAPLRFLNNSFEDISVFLKDFD